MRVLFLTLLDFQSFEERNIYTDLLREFIKTGHEVYCISPGERRTGIRTHFKENGHLLKLRIGNTQKTNIVEKGISTLLLERQFVAAIRKYFSNIKFDLVLYSTPPITFASVVKYVKNRDGAKTYLLLKDIFPQNAVDLGMMQKSGIKGLIYSYFRRKEKKLYSLSDRIGCMSQGNVEYVLRHNAEIAKEKVEVCPNCIDPADMSLNGDGRKAMREQYGIPQDKKVFVYGGNLGKPQGIPFLTACLQSQKDNRDVFFLIVGDGTEYGTLEAYIKTEKPANVRLMQRLPKEDYDRMIAACDVGLIFLDHRFTVPNFPSRLLSYLQAKLPVLAVTDPNTDIGAVIEEGGFGCWCESDDAACFAEAVATLCNGDLQDMGNRAWAYLLTHYTAAGAAARILNQDLSDNK